MNDSTRRTFRTAYQTLVALLTLIPILLTVVLEALPEGSDLRLKVAAIAVSILAGVTAVAKIITSLEDRGIIPPWLKSDTLVNDKTIPGVVVDSETADALEPDYGEHEQL